MAFFLIGRGPEDDLHLLSATPLASRHDAMAELSRISSSPDFDQWDSDVFVIDLDSGIPVLLVRPTGASQQSTESIVAEAPEQVVVVSAADAWLADMPVDSAGAVALEDAVVVESAAEVEPEPHESSVPVVEVATDDGPGLVAAQAEEPESLAAQVFDEPPALGEEATEEPVAARSDDEAVAEEEWASALVGEESPSEELGEEPVLVESEETPRTEPVGDPAIADQIVAQSMSGSRRESLRDAIQRTTEHMAEEGVVPPESIGAAEPFESAAELEPQEGEPAEHVAEGSESVADETAETAAAWPWDVAHDEQPPVPAVAPELAFVYSTLEEPAHSDEERLSPSADLGEDARPVALGSLVDSGEAPVDSTHEVATAHSPMSSLGELVGPDDGSDFIDLEEVAPDATAVPEKLEDSAGASESDDLETTPEQPGFSAAPGAEKMLRDYTCDDCVYVETCPNKDQRLPKDCGSFQWK